MHMHFASGPPILHKHFRILGQTPPPSRAYVILEWSLTLAGNVDMLETHCPILCMSLNILYFETRIHCCVPHYLVLILKSSIQKVQKLVISSISAGRVPTNNNNNNNNCNKTKQQNLMMQTISLQVSNVIVLNLQDKTTKTS